MLDSKSLFTLLLVYVMAATARVITTKLTDMHVITEYPHHKNLPLHHVYYRHPVFQTTVGFVFEFLVFVVSALYLKVFNKSWPSFSETSMYAFILPGLCDLIDTLTLNIGMTLESSSVTTMIRSLVSPFTACIAFYVLRQRFSWSQVNSIGLVLGGVAVACLVEVFFQTEEGKLVITSTGLLILFISAVFQALQAVLEERIFRLDPGLSPIAFCGAQAFWKLVMLLILEPTYQRIRLSKDISETGTAENFKRAISLLQEDNTLLFLVLITGMMGALSHAFGYGVIKFKNALHQSTIHLTIVGFTWVFFQLWTGPGHEKFNPLTLVGMAALAVGTHQYVNSDDEPVTESKQYKVQEDTKNEAEDSKTDDC